MADLRLYVETMVFNARMRSPGAERPVALAADIDLMVHRARADGDIDAAEAHYAREALARITPPDDVHRRMLEETARPMLGPIACFPEIQADCVNGHVPPRPAAPGAPADEEIFSPSTPKPPPHVARTGPPPSSEPHLDETRLTPIPRRPTASARDTAEALLSTLRETAGDGDSELLDGAADAYWNVLQTELSTTPDASRNMEIKDLAYETADALLSGSDATEAQAATLRSYLATLSVDGGFIGSVRGDELLDMGI